MDTFRFMPQLSLDECQKALTAPGRVFELESKVIQGREVRVWKNLWPNLRACWMAASIRFQTRTYLTFEDGGVWTYAEVLDWSLQIANLLRAEYRIRKGDRGVSWEILSAISHLSHSRSN